MKQFILIVFILGMGEITIAQWTSGSGTLHTGDKIGIGTSSPQFPLDVNGDNTVSRFSSNGGYVDIILKNSSHTSYIGEYSFGLGFFSNNGSIPTMSISPGAPGNVGIGTTNAYNPLSIQGNDNQLNIGTSGTAQNAGIFFSDGTPTTSSNYKWELYKTTNNDFSFYNYVTGSSNMLIRSSTGNVGIGTTDPGSYKLAVNGHVRAKEIKVDTDWSDFVFEPDYKLLSLKETEDYIKKNKHLPEIPSAKEVDKEGINVGEMNAKLLQKIEELTLHLIEQNKENNKLRTMVQEQGAKIQDLCKDVNQLKYKP